jgi:hypothetical protein
MTLRQSNRRKPTIEPGLSAGGTIIPAPKISHLIIVVGLITLIGTFYLSTIRSGHGWGDDFAMYIQEAKNIANHVSYTRSYYIFNPLYPYVGPKVYPIVYPLLLSPIYATFGLDLTAMKVENIFFFLTCLLICFFLFCHGIPFPYVTAAIALIGFNPMFWEFKENIVSEWAYLFLLYLCLYYLQKVQRSGMDKPPLIEVPLIIAVIYLSYGVRITGILLIPALLLSEIVRHKRLTGWSVIITFCFVGLWALLQLFLSSDSAYMDMLQSGRLGPGNLWQNIQGYSRELSYFWGKDINKYARVPVLAIFTGISAYGYLLRLKREATVCEFYLALHLILTIVLPFVSGFRYLIPIVPLYVFYGLVGVSKAMNEIRPKIKTYAAFVMLISVAIIYVYSYTKADFGPIQEGIGKRETQELFQYVREKTEMEAVFIFKKPRALGLFAERRASIYPATGSDKDLWRYIETIHASYIVKSPIDEPYWSDFIEKNRVNLQQTFVNADFTVYKVTTLSPLAED